MTRFLQTLAVGLLLASCQNSDVKTTGSLTKASTDTASYTNITWLDSLKDIGTVAGGKNAEIKFRFKNTGTKPLFIISAQPGCGCTVADYPKEAIAPGAEGVITANYDAPKGGATDFRKNIVVTTNTKGNTSHNVFFFGKIEGNADATSGNSATDSTKVKNL